MSAPTATTYVETPASYARFVAQTVKSRGGCVPFESGSAQVSGSPSVASRMIFGPGVAGHVLRFFASPSGHAPSPPNAFPELTDRERDILELLAQGRRTGAIAQTLFLSPKTVSNHLTSIFAKLQVVGRSEAIVRAREGGFGGGS